MRIRQLQTFIAVVEQGSIHAAARALGVSQPAVTKTIRELEEGLGAPLFERNSTGVRVSRYGEVFEPRARLLLEEARRAKEEVAQMRDANAGRVAIGITTSVATSILPFAYKGLRAELPACEIEVTEGTFPALLKDLRNGTFDFVVAHQALPTRDARFGYIELFDVDVFICARRSNPLIHARSLHELQDAEWILAQFGSRDDTDSLFAACGLKTPQRIVYVHSVAVGLSLLSESDMVAPLVEPVFRSLPRDLDIGVIRFRETLLPTKVCVIYRQGESLTPVARQFVAHFKKARNG